MPPEGAAADAQAEKRAAEDRKHRRQAKGLIVRLLAAAMGPKDQEIDPALEKDAFTYLLEDAERGK